MLSVVPAVALALALSSPAPGEPARCEQWLEVGPIGSATDDLARVAQLTGASPVRPEMFRSWSSAPEVALCDGLAPHPSEVAGPPRPAGLDLQPLPQEWRTYVNTGYPDDRNDGALWQGKGISTELNGGFRLRWGVFSAAFAPVVAWQQNAAYDMPLNMQPGFSPYANPFYEKNGFGIDLPLRFGNSAFWTLDPGQSYARVDLFNVALGVSTENMWWGPGTRNSILMTNSAPGFPHVFLGTSHPQDIWIGWLEAQMTWGWPRQSDWFQSDPAKSDRVFAALNLGYEPRWIPGLFFGFTRVYLYANPPGGLPIGKYLAPVTQFFFKSDVNDDPYALNADNQLLSFSVRWVFPSSGLEIYGEWGRDDHSWDLRDFVTEPEHASAYMFGLQKVFRTGVGWARATAELANTLEKPTNNPTRLVPIFYTHWGERQGYTNDGQMLGAGIGPEASSQYLALDLFHARGRTGLWFERVQRNGKYFYDYIHHMYDEDTEIAFGVRGVHSWRQLDVEYGLGLGHRVNMNFMHDVDSWRSLLSLTWWPGRSAPPALPLPHPHEERELMPCSPLSLR